ncbi:MAG: DUF1896 family protein [Ginsengibacter sp.]
MQEVLHLKLHQYIRDNNPDLLINLQLDGDVGNYIKNSVASVDVLMNEMMASNTPAYIIEERCMDELTRELRPSKFNYLRSILEEEFEIDFQRLKEKGLLTYEIINIIEACNPVFEVFGFNEKSESNRHLQYCILGSIKEYLEKNSEKENVRYGF